MKQILKQTSWLVIAQLISKIIGFFYTIFLARNLGVLDFGLYSVAFAYFSIISSMTEFGFTRFLVREVARDKGKGASLFVNINCLRLTSTSVLFAFFSLILYFWDPDKIRVSITLLAILAVIPQSVNSTFDGIFAAIRKLEYSSISLIFLNLSTTILGVILINSGYGPTGAVTSLIIGQLLNLVLQAFFLKKLRFHFPLHTSWQTFKQIIKGSLPFGLLGILGLLYFKVDTLMLSYLKGNFDTGIYGVAYKFFEAVVFIPAALSTALFPVLANLHDHNKDQVKKLYFKSLKILFVLSLVVVLGYILILPIIIDTFLPNYLPAISAIKILSLAIPFMFSHYPAVQVLLSSDQYIKQILILSVALLVLNVFLNLIFIPQYGFIAACWVTVLSEALSFLIYFKFLSTKVFNKS